VTGVQIELDQKGERKKVAVGCRASSIITVIASKLAGINVDANDLSQEVALIIARTRRSTTRLTVHGALGPESLGCKRTENCTAIRTVSPSLRHWHESRGLAVPDGRLRRSQMQRKHTTPPPFQQIGDQVMGLFNQDLLYDEIAAQIPCDVNTVTKAIRFWHVSRGLPVPDGRARRARIESDRKRRKQDEQTDN
jgi:hypothetical protein